MAGFGTQRRFEITEAGRRALREWEPRNGAAAAEAWRGASVRMARTWRAGQVSNILRAILILLLVFVMTATAHAVEATAQEFLDKYEHGDATERQTLLNVIKDLQEGVSWADAYNQAHGVARLYCPPGPIFSLEPDRLIDMLRREVEARPVTRREPWQLATIGALRNVFPCKPRRS
jgi:hypothetical protein